MTHGVLLSCEVNPEPGAMLQCICCGTRFLSDAAVLTVRSGGELLGYIDPTNASDSVKARYAEKCRTYSAGGQK